eukprot:contig_15845_g3800
MKYEVEYARHTQCILKAACARYLRAPSKRRHHRSAGSRAAPAANDTPIPAAQSKTRTPPLAGVSPSTYTTIAVAPLTVRIRLAHPPRSTQAPHQPTRPPPPHPPGFVHKARPTATPRNRRRCSRRRQHWPPRPVSHTTDAPPPTGFQSFIYSSDVSRRRRMVDRI